MEGEELKHSNIQNKPSIKFLITNQKRNFSQSLTSALIDFFTFFGSIKFGGGEGGLKRDISIPALTECTIIKIKTNKEQIGLNRNLSKNFIFA